MQKLFHYVKFIPLEAVDERKNALTLVPREGVFAALLAVKYVIENDIKGDIVECGVWRGGMSILMAGMLKLHGSSKKVYLYDTFCGMTAPGAKDGFVGQEPEVNDLIKHGSSLTDVKMYFENVDLLNDNLVFVEGDVMESLAVHENLPNKIALLRLDTDMYESTKCEMEFLFPLLSHAGVLIVDDYGSMGWIGSRSAVDEYFGKNGKRPFFSYIDRNARIGIKSI